MLNNDIGINARTIWQLLSQKGSLSIREIGEITTYKDALILIALGWLGKENKIRFIDKDGALHVEPNKSLAEIYY